MNKTLTSFTESMQHAGWTLERFGFSPAKVRYRVHSANAPRVFCVSIPKAGTHLLERALCLHPELRRRLLPTVSDENIGRWTSLDRLLDRVAPGEVITSHLRYKAEYPLTLDAHGVRTFFLIRDPHDIVISEVHYVLKRRDHRAHRFFAGLPDMHTRLRAAIVGVPESKLPSIGERLDYFSGWLGSGLVVRFEDLVGPRGGGDVTTQTDAIQAIYDHLGIALDPRTRDDICARVFSSDSPTFRSGSVSGWKRHFDAELEALFDDVVGDRSSRYGY